MNGAGATWVDRESAPRQATDNESRPLRSPRVEGQRVFALRDLQTGDFIFRRRHGRVVENHDIETLSLDDERHLCELDFTTSAVLLSPGCYRNHSRDPNAMRSGVEASAWRPLKAGDPARVVRALTHSE
jgi:hypothetical protein